MKARWTGCSRPSRASPSTVVMTWPAASETRAWQAWTGQGPAGAPVWQKLAKPMRLKVVDGDDRLFALFKSGNFGGLTLSGDCTLVYTTGVITCLDTNGTAFGTMATQNASAVNITGATALTGLPAPVAASDAATKSYVDSAAVGLVVHTAVAWATVTGLVTKALTPWTSTAPGGVP